MTDTPQRCTNDQRQQAHGQLSRALSQGQITMEEFEERSSQCWAATYTSDLDELLKDIPDPQSGSPATTHPQAPSHYSSASSPVEISVNQALATVTGEPGTASMSLALFGGSERKNWVVPQQHTALALFGGVATNLAAARFNSPHTEISANALFGGTEIIVPEGFRINVDGIGIFGGYSTKVQRNAIHPDQLPPDAPSITIKGIALFGGVQVTVVPRKG